VALGAWNVLRPRGRAALGLSAGILGNGFALSRRALQAVPYSADSIVEDVEYHHLLVRAGLRVHWVDGAWVRGDMPVARSAAAQQRARWEGGRLRLLASQGPALAAGVLRGQWRLLDPLLDLLLWPLAWQVSLLLLALTLGAAPVQIAAGAGLAVVALHVTVALWLMPARREHLRALLGAPAYVIWKLRLAATTWRAAGRHATWVRSARRPS
jgi:cellulose synthase/poly-beta-1,6-N-acetylglucosamine synthase-like glycosyltransferase